MTAPVAWAPTVALLKPIVRMNVGRSGSVTVAVTQYFTAAPSFGVVMSDAIIILALTAELLPCSLYVPYWHPALRLPVVEALHAVGVGWQITTEPQVMVPVPAAATAAVTAASTAACATCFR